MRQCLSAIMICLLLATAPALPSAQGLSGPSSTNSEAVPARPLRPEVQATLQPAIARFRRIDARDGLSQDSVLALAQDRQGRVWLGTQDGLNRFDGFELTTYRPIPDDPASLAGPWAGRLAIDTEGVLWVGSTAGLARRDPISGQFQSMPTTSDHEGGLLGQTVFALHVDRSGRVWVGTDAGLNLWQAEAGRFASFVPPSADPRVTQLSSAADGSLWVGTLDGVFRYSTEQQRFDQPPALRSINAAITALLVDRRSRLWIGSEDEGLWRVDLGSDSAAEHWLPDPQESESGLGDRRIRSLFEDRVGRLWIGHETGLDCLLEGGSASGASSARFLHYRHSRYDPLSLGRGPVVSLLEDHNGDLWIGTWEGGVSLLSPTLNRMISLNPDVAMASAMRAASVRSLLPADDGWWLGSESGLYRFHRTPALLRQVNGSEGLFSYELHKDQFAEQIWIGSSRGLWRLQLDGEQLSKPDQPARILNARIRRVWAEQDRIWLAMMPEGLLVLDRQSLRELAFYPIGGIVAFIRRLDDQTMLVGAQDGLYWFEPDASLRYRHVVGAGEGERSLPAAPTNFLRAADGKIWLGSSGAGVLEMQLDSSGRPEATRFRSFDRRMGLAADSVGWLEQDADGALWASTTVGISRFDPASKRMRNYQFSDGTLGRSYWIGAGAKAADGQIAFGGFDGLTLFYPASFRTPRPAPVPLLTGYALGSQWTELSGAAETPPLQLAADERRGLSLRMSAREFALPAQLRFEYRLRGFDEDWSEAADNQRVISFTSLPPGQFEFQARTRNADGDISDPKSLLTLNVVPAWWQTTAARLVAIFLLLALVVLWGRWRLTRAQRHNAWLKRRVRERTADIEQLAEIGRELTATLDVEQAMERVYQRISARLDVHVFAIAVNQESEGVLRVMYLVEAGSRVQGMEFSLQELDRPAVWCVTHRQPLITTRQSDLLNFVHTNLPAQYGDETESIVYLPLTIGERVIGCLTVQSLAVDAYSADQLAFLEVLASYSAIAIDNALNYRRLDQAVAERTQNILTLAEVGRELTATLDAERAMQQVYEHVSEVLDTFVFFIGWLEEDQRSIRLAFAVENGQRLQAANFSIDDSSRPGARCVREQREIVVQSESELRENLAVLAPPLRGVRTRSMVFIPLIHNARARGYLSVQSMRWHAYSEPQLEFLRVLASYTAIALENARSYQTLDQTVAARTAELRLALDELRSAQRSLIEREKMASLGGLVAGVAHEVNTPLGIAVTAASHLEIEAKRTFKALDEGRLSRTAMAEFRTACDEGLRLIAGSLRRAHVLIGSFKQVAVDQSSEERRRFDLHTTLEEILFSLRPSYRRAGHQLQLDCPHDIQLDSYPGALFQVVTNLVTNATLHAFPEGRIGAVNVDVKAAPHGHVRLRISDDGLGMDEATQDRIFEPFFTTRRSAGGSGLGLHLVYNLVTQLLGGSIAVSSQLGDGTSFDIVLPLVAPITPSSAEEQRR